MRDSFFQIDVSPLVWRVFKRHLIVFSRNWKVNITFNFIEPFLYLIALGIGLGAYVQPIEGLPYLKYLAPGLVVSSAMFAASYECTYGTFVRMEFQKTFQAMVTTPISIDDVIAGEIIYGAFKSTLYGIIFLLVTLVLGLVASPWVFLMPFLLALAGLFFAIISIIWTGLVPRIESFNYFFTLIMTPVFLFSGIFFPLSGLPQFIQKIAWFNPLFHVTNLSRGLILGPLGQGLWLDLLWLLVFTILLFPLPIYLMRRLVIK